MHWSICTSQGRRTSIFLLSVFVIWSISCTDAANILGVFTSHSTSHLIVHMGLANTLAEAGHNVTVVCAQQPKLAHKSINIIVIPNTKEDELSMQQINTAMGSQKHTYVTTVWKNLQSMRKLIQMQYTVLKNARFQELYENSANKFDLVISGYFFNDFQNGVAAVFKCPLILNYMMRSNEFLDDLLGNPNEPAYVPTVDVSLRPGEHMDFAKRLHNTFVHFFFKWFQFYMSSDLMNYYNDLFPFKNFPSYEQMQKNVSLAFVNHHFSEGGVRPYVPAMVEIGGIQIKETPNPLPKDLAEFLEGAQNGAILFSLGTNIKMSGMKQLPEIFAAFASLKQRIIWKWDDMSKTPGTASNILYRQWLPQDDLLAHPKLKLFITHAGKGGLAEAQYHGVPMIALPAYADQYSNAENLEMSGYGLSLNAAQLTATKLKGAIEEIIGNSSYAENIKRFSQLYRDRPLTAKQNAVFWTEYVLRHHGASHMQSPLVHMSFIEANNLDVLALFVLVLYVAWKLFKFVIYLVGVVCLKSVWMKKSKSKKQ